MKKYTVKASTSKELVFEDVEAETEQQAILTVFDELTASQGQKNNFFRLLKFTTEEKK